MTPAMLIIEYRLGDAQRALRPEDWEKKAEQISSIDGLRWKRWLRGAEDGERGGVYLFEDEGRALRARDALVASLEAGGARGVTSRVYEVDAELSAITRAPITRAP